jgi:hypothetical protein
MQTLIGTNVPAVNFGAWTPTVTGSATVPVGTYSATSGPDSLQGITLAATGTSGGIELAASFSVSPEVMFGFSVTCKGSSATPTLIPIQALWKDAAGNTIVTDTPFASGAAPTSFTKYNAILMSPVGAVSVQVLMGALAWSSTGGYTNVVASPTVVGF